MHDDTLWMISGQRGPAHIPTVIDTDLPNQIQQVQVSPFPFDKIMICFLVNVIAFSDLLYCFLNCYCDFHPLATILKT